VKTKTKQYPKDKDLFANNVEDSENEEKPKRQRTETGEEERTSGNAESSGFGKEANGEGTFGKEANGEGIEEEKDLECSDKEEEDAKSEQDPGDLRSMRKMIDPCLPTRAEVDEHEMTHLPFRNWCRHCIMGRGTERGHFKAERDQDAVAEVHIDYCFPCGAGVKPRNVRERASEAAGSMTVMVLRDRDTRMTAAAVVPRKGTTGDFAAKRAAAFCAEIGYSGIPIIMKSDQEPAMKAVVEEVARWRAPAKTIIEQSPVGSSQSNGIIERAIQSFEGLLRTLKSGLEAKWKAEIPDGHAIYSWMSEYSAFLLNRYEVSSDGKTSYERMKGKKSKQQGLEFGEGILFKKKRVNQPKSSTVWEDGLYLGVKGMSGEMIVGTKAGVWKTRTISRKPKEYRWCQSNIEFVGGVPWRTNADGEEEEADGAMPEVVIKIQTEQMKPEEAAETKSKIEVPRSFMISKADLEKHGYTAKCPGCKASIRGTGRTGHSVECRERLKKEMDGDAKVKEAKRKEIDFHVKVHEDMQEKLKQHEEKREKGAGHDHLAKSHRSHADCEEGDSRRVKRRTDLVPDVATEVAPEETSSSSSSRPKRSREDLREREEVEQDNSDEEKDGDGDLTLNWIEFAMEIQGVEMLKAVNVEEFAGEELQQEIVEAFDDVTGEKMSVEGVRKARREEIDFIEAKGIWEQVPISLCWDKLGRGPTSGKWVDVQKDSGPRSRYVGRDFKPKGEGPRAEIFASMPPLEAKKILFSRAASQVGAIRKKKLLFIDIKKAHMNAICDQWAFIELPEEIREEGMCGQLKHWIYGMRPAARAWEEDYVSKLASEGYQQGRSVPTVFYQEKFDMSGAVHGDDFTFLGYDEDLDTLENLMKGWFDLKVRGRLGPDEGDDKEIIILGRHLKWGPTGISITADAKHADSIKKYCKIDDDSKGLGNPGKKDDTKDFFEEIGKTETYLETEPISDKKLIKEYRGMAATANYLAADRVDLVFAAKELCRDMSAPTGNSFKKLKHLARYLVMVPVVVLFYENQKEPQVLDTFVDSDWAGCTGTRKSTSAGFMVLGKHLIKSWSSTQSTIALSSGEAEFYAIIEGASRALGVEALMDDMGMKGEVRIWSDSSAGRSISLRKGTGKLRHLQVKYLWLQDATFEKRVKVGKVKGTENPADVATKFLTATEMKEVVEKYGVIMKIAEKETKQASRGVSRLSDTEAPVLSRIISHVRGTTAHNDPTRFVDVLAQENNL